MKRERKTPTQEQIREVVGKFKIHLMVMKGLGENTAIGYCRIISKYFRDNRTLNLDNKRIEDGYRG